MNCCFLIVLLNITKLLSKYIFLLQILLHYKLLLYYNYNIIIIIIINMN